MSESPYAIAVEELVKRVWVPEDALVEVQVELRQPPADWSTGVSYGDGAGGDVDGD